MSRFISDYEAELFDNRREIEALHDRNLDLTDDVAALQDEVAEWKARDERNLAEMQEMAGVIELLDHEKQSVIAQCEAWESCYKKVAGTVISQRATIQALQTALAEAGHALWEPSRMDQDFPSQDSVPQQPWISIQDQPQPPTPTDGQPQAAEHSPSAPERPPSTPLPQYSLRPWGWESPKPESEDPSPQQ